MDQGVIERVDSVSARYNNDREALVEILRDLSKEMGYISQDAFAALAEKLDLPESAVFGVASFYSMIETKPHGQHVIRFCQDAPCHVAGGREVWDALEAALGIKFGETTPDGQWTLMTTSCIGLCAVGPVMLVDEDVYGNLTPEKIPDILARYTDAGGVA
ncbi:MAG: NADH-quinone oxidoreductase subunit NuoE [Anaerolineae bacterium]|jgi:NADH-quinone oxidoreductase E subunit|nr:NADH-quinone oxidoreductase subunit NuoE [Anaerolineae bacterium]